MNTITLLGRTTSAIELKQSKAGKSVASFSLAVKRPYTKDATDFHNIVAWGNTAELLAKYVNKGNQVCIRGYLTNREWTDKQGNKRISTEIIAEEISFVGGKESSTDAKNEAYTPSAYGGAQMEEVPNDGDLPF
jgi:single-strand DNA-binding protein